MNPATTCSRACPISIPPSPKGPFPFTASLASTQDLPPWSLSLNFTFWRYIHSHSLESHPSKCFPFFSPLLKCCDFNSQVLRKPCGVVLQDVVIYPHETPPSWWGPAGLSVYTRTLMSSNGKGREPGRARNYTEETTHSGERGKQKGKESFWEAPGNQKSPKYEEGGLVGAKGKAPAYFLIHSGVSCRLPCSCLEKKCFQNVFGKFLFIYKLEQVLRISHSNSSFKSGFPLISVLGLTLRR